MSIETTEIRSGAASGERCGVPHVIERAGPGLAPPRTKAAVAIAQTVVEEFSAAIGAGGRARDAGFRARMRRSAVHRRQVAMYVVHVVLGCSLTDIGLACGRDRTTVGHACHMVEDRRDDAAYDSFVAVIERIVGRIFAEKDTADA